MEMEIAYWNLLKQFCFESWELIGKRMLCIIWYHWPTNNEPKNVGYELGNIGNFDIGLSSINKEWGYLGIVSVDDEEEEW